LARKPVFMPACSMPAANIFPSLMPTFSNGRKSSGKWWKSWIPNRNSMSWPHIRTGAMKVKFSPSLKRASIPS
jgi:hypothetical protein